MTSSKELLKRREAVVPRGAGRLNSIAAASAKGAVITDLEGKRYIDLATGIGVMSAGHTAEPVVRAIAEQAAKLQHACIHVSTYEPYIALCEKLATLFPHGPQTKVLLLNSGAEAVENAVKIARQKTGRPGVMCFTEAFHGRTLLCLSLTSKVGYKKGCGPFAPEVYRLPYPNYHRYGDGLPLPAFVERELSRFKQALVNTVAPEQLACVIIEVVQGEGGFTVCPPEYLAGLRSICSDHGIMLICDEVQAGCGRTGRWAAYEHAGIVPDLSTWAKAMGGGLPVSAVIGRAEIMDAALPGTLGGTYGGNPVACASALATLELMEREDLPKRAAEIGKRIVDRLSALKSSCPVVSDVRGLGAMVAIELAYDGDPLKPATAPVAEVLERCIDRGILIIPAGAHSNVIRLLPPLVISNQELDRALSVLEEEVRKVANWSEPGAA